MIEQTIKELKKIGHRDYICNFLETLTDPVICEVGVKIAANFDKMLIPNVKAAIGVDIWRAGLGVLEFDRTEEKHYEETFEQDILNLQYKDVFNQYLPQNRIRIVREFSVNAARFFPDETFDFIYIDADHIYEAVSEDLAAWYPKVKVGGVIGGHDYISREETIRRGHSSPFGVVEAVADFRKEHDLSEDNFHVTNEDYASYFMVKE